jgi:hypothetical protein
MTSTKIRALRIALAAIVGVGCLFVRERVSQPGSLVTSAHAIIGRPLTPLSYAGVARRSAVGVGVGVGVGVAVGVAVARPVVVVPAPVVVAPMCAQVVNVYGQITTVCR